MLKSSPRPLCCAVFKYAGYVFKRAPRPSTGIESKKRRMHRERIFRFCKAAGRGNTGRISAGSTYTRPCGLRPRRKCRAYFKGRQRGKPQQSTSLRRIVLRLHCLSTNAVRNFDLACVEQHIGSALFPWSSSALRLKAAGRCTAALRPSLLREEGAGGGDAYPAQFALSFKAKNRKRHKNGRRI